MNNERIKILYKHLSKREQIEIKNKLNRVKLGTIPNHCLERMYEKNVSMEECYDVLKEYEVIELNFTYNENDIRALLRGKGRDRKGYCTCMVLDIFTGTMCTVWKNHIRDNHRKLRLNQYSEANKIRQLNYFKKLTKLC